MKKRLRSIGPSTSGRNSVKIINHTLCSCKIWKFIRIHCCYLSWSNCIGVPRSVLCGRIIVFKSCSCKNEHFILTRLSLLFTVLLFALSIVYLSKIIWLHEPDQNYLQKYGRGDWIWTSDLTVPNGARYQAAPHPAIQDFAIIPHNMAACLLSLLSKPMCPLTSIRLACGVHPRNVNATHVSTNFVCYKMRRDMYYALGGTISALSTSHAVGYTVSDSNV